MKVIIKVFIAGEVVLCFDKINRMFLCSRDYGKQLKKSLQTVDKHNYNIIVKNSVCCMLYLVSSILNTSISSFIFRMK